MHRGSGLCVRWECLLMLNEPGHCTRLGIDIFLPYIGLGQHRAQFKQIKGHKLQFNSNFNIQWIFQLCFIHIGGNIPIVACQAILRKYFNCSQICEHKYLIELATKNRKACGPPDLAYFKNNRWVNIFSGKSVSMRPNMDLKMKMMCTLNHDHVVTYYFLTHPPKYHCGVTYI